MAGSRIQVKPVKIYVLVSDWFYGKKVERTTLTSYVPKRDQSVWPLSGDSLIHTMGGRENTKREMAQRHVSHLRQEDKEEIREGCEKSVFVSEARGKILLSFLFLYIFLSTSCVVK